SIHNSPRPFAMTTSSSSRRQSCDDLDVESEDGEVTSRKEKSLGLLCQRFLVAMNEETRVSSSREVHLETVARKMNVEKRRIYDIVNVMEALDAMSKTNKSYYRWHGLEGLPKLMADLQKEAIEEHLPERVLRVEQAMCSFTELSPGSRKIGVKEIVGSLVGEDANPCSSTHSVDVLNLSQPSEKRNRVDGRDRQGRNSLAQLCRRFLMVLLSN
ncbi:transcription factor E2F/dimerization partner, partial [Teladorsagia circumcincta]